MATLQIATPEKRVFSQFYGFFKTFLNGNAANLRKKRRLLCIYPPPPPPPPLEGGGGGRRRRRRCLFLLLAAIKRFVRVLLSVMMTTSTTLSTPRLSPPPLPVFHHFSGIVGDFWTNLHISIFQLTPLPNFMNNGVLICIWTMAEMEWNGIELNWSIWLMRSEWLWIIQYYEFIMKLENWSGLLSASRWRQSDAGRIDPPAPRSSFVSRPAPPPPPPPSAADSHLHIKRIQFAYFTSFCVFHLFEFERVNLIFPNFNPHLHIKPRPRFHISQMLIVMINYEWIRFEMLWEWNDWFNGKMGCWLEE